jgi:hypothetical protein
METLVPLAIGIVLSLFTTGWVEAQEVRYDLTGNYPDTAPLTSLTAPGGAFDFQFVVPASVANDTQPNEPLFITAPILSGAYIFGGSTDPVSSGTYLFSNSAGNLTEISLTTSVADIGLSSTNTPTLAIPDFSGQAHFRTGEFLAPLNRIDFTPSQGAPFFVDIVSASIVGVAVPVPEPSSLGLLTLGLLFCGGVALLHQRRRHNGKRSARLAT